MNHALSKTQISKQTYEGKYLKVTLRLDKSITHYLDHLSNTHGTQKAALEHAIKHAYIGARQSNNQVLELQDENVKLRARIDELEAENAHLKRGQYTQEERDELLESIMDDYEKRRQTAFNLNHNIDTVFIDIEAQSLDLDEII